MKKGGATGETLFVLIGAGCNYLDEGKFMYLPTTQPRNSQVWLFDELEEDEIRRGIEYHLDEWLIKGNRTHIKRNISSVKDILENIREPFSKIIIISYTESVPQLNLEGYDNMLFIYTGHTDRQYDLNKLIMLDLSVKPTLVRLNRQVIKLMLLYEIISRKETLLYTLDRHHFLGFYCKYRRMLHRLNIYSQTRGLCDVISIPLIKLEEISKDLNNFFNRKANFLTYISRNSLGEDEAGFNTYMEKNSINESNKQSYRWQCLVFPFTERGVFNLCGEDLVTFTF